MYDTKNWIYCLLCLMEIEVKHNNIKTTFFTPQNDRKWLGNDYLYPGGLGVLELRHEWW